MTKRVKHLELKNIKTLTKGGKLVLRPFNQPDPDTEHVRLDQMLDQTIYITKIEPISSDEYGSGYKLWFRDIPGAKQGYTAACFGMIVERQLEPLFVDSHMGADIDEKHPFKVKVAKAGRSYMFVEA